MLDLHVAPNIVGEGTTALMSFRSRSYARLVLYDGAGSIRKVIAERMYEGGEWQVAVNVGCLSSGTYWLRLEGEEGAVSVPLHIVH